jgi:cytochrome d ubiquinol oxidase subunit II
MTVMLAGLVLRGVSFEFREKSRGRRAFWDWCFILGSLVASFVQGMTVGALVAGLPVVDGRFTGGAFDWLSPFALLCGVGLCLGYALLGAGWLARKAGGEVQALAFRVLPRLLAGVLSFLGVIFVYSLMLDLAVMDRWLERPVLFVFPMIGVIACLVMARAIGRGGDLLPFLCGLALFGSAFGTLAVSFYPYMIPFSVTIEQAAAPVASQSFIFWGAGVIVLPITVVYTLVVYFVFKGKARQEDGYELPPESSP